MRTPGYHAEQRTACQRCKRLHTDHRRGQRLIISQRQCCGCQHRGGAVCDAAGDIAHKQMGERLVAKHRHQRDLFSFLSSGCLGIGRQQGFLEILQNPGEQEKNTGDNEGSQHDPVIGIPDTEKAEQCAYAKGNGRTP